MPGHWGSCREFQLDADEGAVCRSASKSGLNGVEAVDAEGVGDDAAGRAAAIDRVRGAMALNKRGERDG